MLSRCFVTCLILSLLANHGYGESPTVETLRTLSTFAPQETDTFVILRHGLLSENSMVSEQFEDATATFTSNAPFKPSDIEQLTLLFTSPNNASAGSFTGLAAELTPGMPSEIQEGDSGKNKALLEDFAAHVRFKQPVTLANLKDAIETQSESFSSLSANVNNSGSIDAPKVEYHIVNWQDKEFLYTKHAGLPAILKVDEQSFIICPFTQLRTGFARKSPGVSWFESFEGEDLAADFVVGSELNPAVAEMAAEGPMQPLSKTKRFIAAVDMDGATLAFVRLQFESNNAAQDVLSMIQGFHAMGKGMIKQQAEQLSGFLGGEEKTKSLSDQLEAIYNSIAFKQDQSTASIVIPRPDRFEELIAGIIEIGKEQQTRNVVQFEDVSKELDSVSEESLPIEDVDPEQALKVLGIE